MSILAPEGSIIFVYLSFFYNALLAIKLIYDSFTQKVEKNKIVWNLISSVMILTGTILLFLWFPRAFTPTVGWGAFAGTIILFVNNLAVTILAFLKLIKASTLGKVANVIFTLLALITMMQYLHKISALTSFILPRGLGWLTAIPGIGYAQFQAFFYGQIGYFYPTLIFIPIAVPIKFRRQEISEKSSEKSKENNQRSKNETLKKNIDKKEEKKRNVFLDKPEKEDLEPPPRPSMFASFRTFMDNSTKVIYGALAILILVFCSLGIGTMTSYNPYTSSDYLPVYVERDDFEFGVTIQSISYQITELDDYETLLQQEIDLLNDLNPTVVRLDVRKELVDNYSIELGVIISTLKSNGFKILLSAYGYAPPTWFFQNVSFTEFTDTIHNQSIELVQLYNPEYLIIYPEPFGFSSAFVSDLKEPEEWATVINDTTNYIHSLTNETKVGINLSYNDFDPSIDLFTPLWENSTLDFIGMDYYIIHARDLDFSYYLDKATNSTKEFWFTEFGISAVVYGERIQAGALAGMLEYCVNNEKVHGFIYYSLVDDFYGANTLGLVTETGYVRMAFNKYKEIIELVTG